MRTLALLLALSSPALAGVVFEVETRNKRRPSARPRMEYYKIQGDFVAIYSLDATIAVKGKLMRIYNSRTKQYVEFTLEDFAAFAKKKRSASEQKEPEERVVAGETSTVDGVEYVAYAVHRGDAVVRRFMTRKPGKSALHVEAVAGLMVLNAFLSLMPRDPSNVTGFEQLAKLGGNFPTMTRDYRDGKHVRTVLFKDVRAGKLPVEKMWSPEGYTKTDPK